MPEIKTHTDALDEADADHTLQALPPPPRRRLRQLRRVVLEFPTRGVLPLFVVGFANNLPVNFEGVS